MGAIPMNSKQTIKQRRMKGVFKLVIGLIGAIGVFFLSWYLYSHNYRVGGKALFTLAIPGVYGLIGLLELVTGKPVSEISEWWDSLKGWQRGVYGTAVVFAGFFVLMIIMFIVAGIEEAK